MDVKGKFKQRRGVRQCGVECQAREFEFYPRNFQMLASESCPQTELYKKWQSNTKPKVNSL